MMGATRKGTTGHTSHEFDRELREVKDRMLAMAGRCEGMIVSAMRALETGDRALADRVGDEDLLVDRDEIRVDDLTVRILALRQPVGRDLRLLICALKVVTDIERIGDEAVNIGERARELADSGPLPEPSVALTEMARLTTAMLRQALDAFVAEEAGAAQNVLASDDAVDDLYGQIFRASTEYMAQNPDRIRAAMAIASCAKYLERIADHATNIAEMVVYMVRGEDVRHGRGEQI